MDTLRCIVFLLILGFGSDVAAQSNLFIKPGSRVRIWSDSRSTVGILDRVQGQQLYLLDGGGEEWHLDAVDRIELSTGQRRHTLAGGLVGLAMGFVLAHLAVERIDTNDSFGGIGNEKEIVLTVAAVLGGSTLAGIAIGYASKTDDWETVYVSNNLGASREEPGPLALSLQIRF